MIMGNMTRDPELRYTAGGQAVCNFSLAANRYFKDKQGEKQEDTTYVKVTVWGKQAETTAQYCEKGRCVFVEGRMNSNSWETEDGQKRSSLEVVAENVQFIGRPGGSQQGGAGAVSEGDIPF
jgi:single-strand DNA-binding protein